MLAFEADILVSHLLFFDVSFSNAHFKYIAEQLLKGRCPEYYCVRLF